MDGNAFTQADFAAYDLTMINVWATYCEPCLYEMGDLAELQGMLPKNVQLITICTDAADEMPLAREVLDSVGARFRTLVGGTELEEALLDNVLAVPTTLFVDKDGNMVGQAIVGAPSDDNIAQAYLDIIAQRLTNIE